MTLRINKATLSAEYRNDKIFFLVFFFSGIDLCGFCGSSMNLQTLSAFNEQRVSPLAVHFCQAVSSEFVIFCLFFINLHLLSDFQLSPQVW